MIEVTLVAGRQHPRAVRVTGHAGTDVPGRDLLCASVSTLVQTVFISLSQDWGIDVDGDDDVRPGFFEVRVPRELTAAQRHSLSVLWQAMVTGLRVLADKHPGKLHVVEVEDGQ